MAYDKLEPTYFNLTASQARQEWHALLDPDTLPTDVLKPVFWVHVMSRLKPMAVVDLVTPDGTLDMQVRVISIANGIVNVRPRFIREDKEARAEVYARREDPSTRPDPLNGFAEQTEVREYTPDGYKVGWNPGSKTWYVQLKATGLKLAENIPEKGKALAYAVAHAKASGVDVDEKAA